MLPMVLKINKYLYIAGQKEKRVLPGCYVFLLNPGTTQYIVILASTLFLRFCGIYSQTGGNWDTSMFTLSYTDYISNETNSSLLKCMDLHLYLWLKNLWKFLQKYTMIHIDVYFLPQQLPLDYNFHVGRFSISLSIQGNDSYATNMIDWN